MFHLIPALVSIYVIIRVNMEAAVNGKYIHAGVITVILLLLILYIAMDYAETEVKKALQKKEEEETNKPGTGTPAIAQNTTRNTPRP